MGKLTFKVLVDLDVDFAIDPICRSFHFRVPPIKFLVFFLGLTG